jgi:hypothetical protein
MGRIYTAKLPNGVRAGSTCVDLDGVQVLVTLFNVDGEFSAELAFRSHPSEAWSEPITVTADERS